MTENRFYKFLPDRLKTPSNRRQSSVTEDVLFEPEAFNSIIGQIGDQAGLSSDQLSRDPFIPEMDDERTAYQLSVAATSRVDGQLTSSIYSSAFYTDLVRQISSNGGLTDDHGRLFDSEWSAWTPPIDYDRWVNYGRYYWTGPGDSRVQGEYITKDPEGSRTVIYRVDGQTTITRIVAELSAVPRASFTPGFNIGELKEDCTDPYRTLYKWSGYSWDVLNFVVEQSVPTARDDRQIGQHVYVPITGYFGNRPLVYEYSEPAGRWITRTPIISIVEPTSPTVGMMWEDCRSSPKRGIYKYDGTWTLVEPIDAVTSMSGYGIGSHGDVVFHALELFTVSDKWAANNWWRHLDDLSVFDRDHVSGKQAVRPIVQFWNGMEPFAGDTRSSRHDLPKFNIYMYDDNVGQLSPLTETGAWPGNTVQSSSGLSILQAKVGYGQDDPVMGFPLTFNSTAEIEYELTLETTPIVDAYGDSIMGYRFFKDANTGLARCIWSPASTPLRSVANSDGIFDEPKNLTNNPDHGVLGSFTRSETLAHFISIFDNYSGLPLGSNGYRWSDCDPTLGSTIIDPHSSLLRVMSMLQEQALDFPSATRLMSRDMSRMRNKFYRMLDTVWNEGSMTNADDTYGAGVTATDVTNEVLTRILVGKDSSSAYWYSGMETYNDQLTGEDKPITFPPSTARTGATPAYTVGLMTDIDGTWIVCHDGTLVASTGLEHKDAAIVDLETRFFNRVPTFRRTEELESSARINSPWVFSRYWGNRSWETNAPTVSSVVDNYIAVLSPTMDQRVFSRFQPAFAIWDGSKWLTKRAVAGDTFMDAGTSTLMYYNGFSLCSIKDYPRNGSYDFSIEEKNAVVSREFDRWAISAGIDPALNDTYDANNRWTWNYGSAGVEGHWRGIYTRVYGTDRPHIRPWEICGFTVKPLWWEATWTPDETRDDGSPVYYSTNDMWQEITDASNFPIYVDDSMLLPVASPIPVGDDGFLLDPIEAGIVELSDLTETSRGDRWKYGDGSPLERAFLESTAGKYAEALAGYLMKPARFVESLWADFVRPIGIASLGLWRGPLFVDVNTWRRSKMSESAVHMDRVDGIPISNPGINSWVSESVRLYGGDPTTVFGDRVRSAAVNLAWRTAGFVNKNRTTVSTPSGVQVPFEDIYTLVHNSLPRQTLFHSGVNIIRAGSGYRVYGYDNSNPTFTAELSSVPLVSGDVILTETFTATEDQTEFLLTKFDIGDADVSRFYVIIDGQKVQDRYVTRVPPHSFALTGMTPLLSGQVVTANLDTVQGNPTTRPRWFEIGGQRFEYFPYGSGDIITYQYGHYFESNTDVIQFLVDHGRWMTTQGWMYEDPEDPDPTSNDWLAVAKRFADWSRTGRDTGEIFVDVPGGSIQRLTVPFGNLMSVERIVNGTYSVLDISGLPVRPEDMTVHRLGGQMEIRHNDQNEEIYGLQANVNEIEHIIVLSNKTRFNDLMYDPVTGLRQKRLSVRAYRTSSWAGRLEAPGYVINGQDLIPGFDKMAKDFTRYYNRYDPVDDPEKMMQAHNLYGYRERPWLTELGIAPELKLDYHRALLKYKGTSIPVTAFFNGTTGGSADSWVSEVWAWKTATFGNVGAKRVSRFNVGEEEIKDRRQIVRFLRPGEEPSALQIDIDIEDFDSSNPDADTRWILPPRTNDIFPVSTDGRPALGDTFHRMSIVNPAGSTKFFHWHPSAGLHYPPALSTVDIEAETDPARYNAGVLSGLDPNRTWLSDMVGTVWWDTSVLEYADYESAPSEQEMAKAWGTMPVTPALLTTTDGETLTVYLGDHGFAQSELVYLNLASGQSLLAFVESLTDDFITVSIGNPNDPSYVAYSDLTGITDNFVTSVTNRYVALYQWVESAVEPSLYVDTYPAAGEPKDPENSSWSETEDQLGNAVYYFWVRGLVATLDDKPMSCAEAESLLTNPSVNSVPWFSPMGSNVMVFHTAGISVQDSIEIELVTDDKMSSVHDQWTLLSESNQTETVDSRVISKLIDCLFGEEPAPSGTISYDTNIISFDDNEVSGTREVFN